MSDQGLRRLKRFAGRLGDRLRLVVYLRRQDDHLVSRYQQELKVGRVERLGDWAQPGHVAPLRLRRRAAPS